MQNKRTTNNYKKIDSYSALICAKYFKTEQDFINLICVNSKFKETTEKLRFNPIPINSSKLFPNIQTQYLYSKKDKTLKRKQIIKYEIWYNISYGEYTRYEKRNNVKCHSVEYTQKNREKYGNEIPDCVNLLGDYCFLRCSTLPTINLPPSLKSLGIQCFYACSTLSTIDLANGIQSLGYQCFLGCATLSSIKLPSSLTSIGNQCFSACLSLSSINLPSSLTSLGKQCFIGCSALSSINIPMSLKSFGYQCFYGCDQLKGVINVPNYCF
ncbi:Leucine rich repeat containing protein BspA family protein [Entamoeba marina]